MKHNKLFAMLAVAAALAVSACGGNGDNPSSSAHKHTAAPDAPWQHDNNNHWKDCAANDGGKAENAKHTFGDPTDVVPATCTATGSQKVKCTVCGAEVTQTLPMIDHTWGEWEITQAATCTVDGERKHTCSVCGEEATETITAPGHTWGDWVSIKDPTCTEGGSRKHTCSVCQEEETEQLEPLGHDIQLVDDQGEPEAGKAKVRLYDCSRCDVTYLGFKATEVTPASKERLVFETVTTGEKEEQGARFFGHPIGNDCELDPTTGDPSEGVDAVYSKEQTGDYFEYKFDLTDEQVSVLSGDEGACLLYCDAQPANWMQQNNMDFFAKGSETDWTKAYYIDEDPAHYNEDGSAKEIAGWRYVLYVDGHYQDFDADVATNPMKNNNRGEFVMPYLFKLHKGENTISLRMAAGYRCTFFNFTFRPYVKPVPVTVDQTELEINEGATAQITSTMEGLKYASSSNSVATVDANGLVTGVKAGEATITVSKEGNYKSAKVQVTVKEIAGTFQISGETGVIAPEGGAEWYVSGYAPAASRLRNFKKDSTVTFTFDSEVVGKFNIIFNARGTNVTLADHITLKVNDADVAVQGTYNSANNGVDVLVGQAVLKATGNTLVITTISENSPLNLHYIKFVPAGDDPLPHEHTLGTPVAQTDEAESTIASCECGYKNIKWSAKKFNEAASVIGTKDSSENGSTGIKFSGDVYNKTSGTASEGDHAVYNVNVPEAVASAQLYMRFNRKDAVSAFSAPSGDKSPSYYQKEDGTWGKYEWRYKLFINDVEVPFVPYEAGKEPQTSAKKEVEFAFPCTFALKAGVNKVELQKWGGYTATIVDFTFAYGA